MATKKTKTFREYYQDPEFRKRHQEYMKTKITCDCGKTVMRVNMPRHKRSSYHNKNSKKDFAKEIEQLHQTINDLKQIIKEKI